MTGKSKIKQRSAKDNLTLQANWLETWPSALEVWSRFTRLRPPILCLTDKHAHQEGLSESFAMIRLHDQAVVINLAEVSRYGLEDYAQEILAHEIGHHVLAPANLSDHARMIARMRWALPTVEHHAPLVANLFTDLLINNRLQRSSELSMDDVYRVLHDGRPAGSVWMLYMRIYELLWSLEKGSLGVPFEDDRKEGDAILAVRLLRSYSYEWLDGAGRFAALLLPYLLEDQVDQDLLESWFDTRSAGQGGEPAGLTEEDAGEREGAVHPATDKDLIESESDGTGNEEKASPQPVETIQKPNSSGQSREPFQFGEILRASGIDLSDHEIAIRYYKERALPHLIPFPSRSFPESIDPLPEGLEPWDVGSSLDAVDWLQSILQSPQVIPGVTTVQRMWGTSEGHEPKREPLYLDIYVDSSGSMMNPQTFISYPALAGAIVCLSALRAGALVQATLWSGKNQMEKTSGFVRDETEILRVLTAYFGGGTAFPIPSLRETYIRRSAGDRPVHILVISDDGVSTLFDDDEKGTSGWEVSAMALEKAGGGGTFVLNLPDNWEEVKGYGDCYKVIREARDEQGWYVFRVSSWDDLVSFAKDFSRKNYALRGTP